MSQFKLRINGLATTASIFLACLLATAYVHTRYAESRRVYAQHMGTITFRPHTNPIGALSSYTSQVNHWLNLQMVCTGMVALATIAVLVQVVRQRTARMQTVDTADNTDI
jgi:uncharacterized membrane-anchored protein